MQSASKVWWFQVNNIFNSNAENVLGGKSHTPNLFYQWDYLYTKILIPFFSLSKWMKAILINMHCMYLDIMITCLLFIIAVKYSHLVSFSNLQCGVYPERSDATDCGF